MTIFFPLTSPLLFLPWSLTALAFSLSLVFFFSFSFVLFHFYFLNTPPPSFYLARVKEFAWNYKEKKRKKIKNKNPMHKILLPTKFSRGLVKNRKAVAITVKIKAKGKGYWFDSLFGKCFPFHAWPTPLHLTYTFTLSTLISFPFFSSHTRHLIFHYTTLFFVCALGYKFTDVMIIFI